MSNNPQPSIFRQKAYAHYVESQYKTVVLRLATPPVFLLLWLLIALIGLAGLVAWGSRIPVYVSDSSLINGDNTALIFVDPRQSSQLANGQVVQIEIGTESLSGVISGVTPQILSPEEVRQQYGLAGPTALVVTQPAVVATVKLTLPASNYRGSLASARIEVGQRRAVSFLPGLAGLAGA